MTSITQKNSKQTLFVLLSLIGLTVLGYWLFIYSSFSEIYPLFNTKQTLSWISIDNNLLRKAARADIENILLTREAWQDFNLSVRLLNAKECGLIYDYMDSKNYSFFYLGSQKNEVVSGAVKNGRAKFEDIKQIPEPSNDLFLRLTKEHGSLVLKIGQQIFFTKPASSQAYPWGIMINQADVPPTIFQNLIASGHLHNGQEIKKAMTIGQESSPGRILRGFALFYIFWILLILYTAMIIRPDQVSNKSIAIQKYITPVKIFIWHSFLGICVFWPFVTRGQVAVFSYDNLGEIYPLFIYNKHQFLSIISGHAPWLWNPFIHNGFAFYSNHWDMIYNPLNWPIFLLPEAWVLKGITLKAFLEVVLTGILAYGFYAREFKNERWALLASVCYQLCSLFIFTMSVYPATSLYFAMMLYLYLLWSMEERSGRVNFLLLTIAVVLILTSANVAFIFYACLGLGAITLYRFHGLTKGLIPVVQVVASAWITGFLVSAVRIVSCLLGVVDSNRMMTDFHTLHDRSYMAIRLFVPEIAGWLGPQAYPVLKSSHLNLIFAQLDIPSSNSQNCFFIYFGVIPAIFLILGFCRPWPKEQVFWKIYAMLAIAIALLWQPIWGILSILNFPLNHYSYHVIALPAGICAAIGYAGIYWENRVWTWDQFRNPLFLTCGLLGAYGFVFITYLFPALGPLMRILFIVMGLGILLYYFCNHYHGGLRPSFKEAGFMVLNGLLFSVLIIVTVILVLKPWPKKELVADFMVLPLLWAGAGAVSVLGYQFISNSRKAFTNSGFKILAPWFLAVAGSAIFFHYMFQGNVNIAENLREYTLDVSIGFLRFFFLGQILIMIFILAHRDRSWFEKGFLIVLVMTIADLIVFNARFNDVTAPFYFKESFYPKDFQYILQNKSIVKQMDLMNYRVNHLDRLDMNANKNLIWNLPSYTGTVGYMTTRYSSLLTAFGYPNGIYMLYPEDASNDDRFLDLSAVRYDISEHKEIILRPNALSRMNFYYAGEVYREDNLLLEHLKSNEFDPHQSVLLSNAPGSELPQSGLRSMALPIGQSQPGRVTVDFTNDKPGLVLFAESFDPGWKAVLDKKEVPVIRANYNFMAVSVPRADAHQLNFFYEPKDYKRNLVLTTLGLSIFCCIFISWVLSFKRNRLA